MNVFGATAPRQRAADMDGSIGDMQRQTNTDNLSAKIYGNKLGSLLDEYKDVFHTETTEPAKIPCIHVDLKPEFKHKIFFRPEPLRSRKDQATVNNNYKNVIAQGKAKLNPTSIRNINFVIVP